MSTPLARGVFELHRLTREVVLEWLAKRREADGIVSSTQKRRPERRRGGGSAVYIEDGEFEPDAGKGGRGEEEGAGPGPGSRRAGGGEENVLMSLMSDVAPRKAAAATQESQVSVVWGSASEWGEASVLSLIVLCCEP